MVVGVVDAEIQRFSRIGPIFLSHHHYSVPHVSLVVVVVVVVDFVVVVLVVAVVDSVVVVVASVSIDWRRVIDLVNEQSNP
jgi:hypothetical protein